MEISQKTLLKTKQPTFEKLIFTLKYVDVASVAARMFVQSGFELKSPFTQSALDLYDAPPENVDYSNAIAACNTINTWVEKETKAMIKKLFNPADLDPNTMVALCSALHFKGKWQFPFDKPFDDVFKLNDKDTQKAALMRVKVKNIRSQIGTLV